MIMRINMRFNLEKEEHKKAWEAIQQIVKKDNCSVNQAVINLANKYSDKTTLTGLVNKVVTEIKVELSKYELNEKPEETDKSEETDIIFDFLDEIGL